MGFKTRLIPVLLLKGGLLVRSEGFRTHQIIGNPINEVERYNEWNVDELIYLDITREGGYGARRDDHKHGSLTDPLEILSCVAKSCFMPLTWGGRIRTLDDMRERFRRGADKITINTAAVSTPELIEQAAARFGSQALVVSIDAAKNGSGDYEVVTERGASRTGLSVVDWAQRVEALGAGEILLQSIDEDGRAKGYDTELIQQVCEAVRVPVIACSGVGRFEDFSKGVESGAAAVAAANLWHFKELADRQGKRALATAGVEVRLPKSTSRRRGRSRPVVTV